MTLLRQCPFLFLLCVPYVFCDPCVKSLPSTYSQALAVDFVALLVANGRARHIMYSPAL